ncbi:RNA-binding transcriptional accessory protein [Magnetovirga frankeli]|uniref:Tex family protein n=1 Tax=Magnetovirga frankeli TaxID=947516 RepID=UPI001293E813|nr:RNA-binding transcriptional accessory protein [gamma proteobacterium SS-5]
MSLAPIPVRIAEELSCRPAQVEAVMQLLAEGATIPFIARYRKEVHGGLDDTQLRHLEERLGYLTELEERRVSVLKSIEEQGKLTPELASAIQAAESKVRLEDLYLPYKQKRRTKAAIAREAGLEPLALSLLDDPTQDPALRAAAFVDADKGVADAAAALDGARQILMEHFAEDAELLGDLRQLLQQESQLRAQLVAGKETEGAKFADYFDYSEPLAKAPSHRALALFRGRKEGVLNLNLALADDEGLGHNELGRCERRIAAHFGISDQQRPADAWLKETVRWTWRVKLAFHLETDLFGSLREVAEEEAIRVFARNLQDLLLAAPAGPRATLGLDPGLRTGVKVAVVDATGKLLDAATVYPHVPQRQWDQSLAVLGALCQRHGVQLIAIGNGTASRETDQLAAELVKQLPQLRLQKIMVSEAGASVYSASELAAREFPELDVSLRGAVSIARRLQDPLAELVKIDPKSIGVGQYQHDLSQTRLARTLDAVVEDCVNAVGVDLNTASAPLLARVAGLSANLAAQIVAHRDQHGTFAGREQLKQVPRLGPKTFEQCAGFLRVMNGSNPLDASAVHPEAYPLVQRILQQTGKPIGELIGNTGLISRLAANDYVDERFGEPTVRDILKELEKPGRDPRPEFKTAEFKEGVEQISDLQLGMILEGVVTNVANFGAFVDVGVHQDGLVHISALSDKFVKDPHQVVKAGDVVKVKVMALDIPRKRIGLSMRLNDDPRDQEAQAGASDKRSRPARRGAPQKPAQLPAKPAQPTAMANAFAKLKR